VNYHLTLHHAFLLSLTDSLPPSSNTEADWGQDENHDITSVPTIPSSEQVKSSDIVEIEFVSFDT